MRSRITLWLLYDVLIETYWNVNTAIWETRDLKTRINRNILECKYAWGCNRTNRHNSINRNILECKVVSVQPLLTFSNSINRNILECKGKWSRFSEKFVFCINRNILECKDSHQSMEGPKRRLVLIETYWNVNSVIWMWIQVTIEY